MGFASKKVWVMGYQRVMGYGFQTWWIENPIGYGRVWVIRAMG
jgi:hypothetical protein